MKMILLGTGTSHGIPAIACNCRVCQSTDSHDKRLRSSAYVTHSNADGTKTHILIDIGPEFRIQALTYGITAVDAVLLTHSHADHLHGLDDIRVFSHTKADGASLPPGADPRLAEQTEGGGIAIYSAKNTLHDVQNRFDYIFKATQIGGGKPLLRLTEAESAFGKTQPPEFGEVHVTPIPMKHGTLDTTGWVLTVNKADGAHSIAYLTDASYISEESINRIKSCGKIDHAIIDALKEKPHPTHFSFLQAMELADRIQPTHTWLTHICHRSSHAEITAYCKAHTAKFPNLAKITQNGGTVLPAYDGLVVEVL